MKKTILLPALLFSLALPAYAAEDHHGHEKHTAPEALSQNPLKAEMRLLDRAYKNLLDALILDKPETIEGPFHAVHTAKMATEKALHEGQIKIPKNGDKLDDFVRMDKAFHSRLNRLLSSVRKGDKNAIRISAHEILDGCVECHTMFRK